MRCYGKEAFAVCSLMAVKLEGLCSLQIILDFILKSAAGKKNLPKGSMIYGLVGNQNTLKWLLSQGETPSVCEISVNGVWQQISGKGALHGNRLPHAVTRCAHISCCMHVHVDACFDPWTALVAWHVQPIIECCLHLGWDVCYLIPLEWSHRNGLEGMRGNWACQPRLLTERPRSIASLESTSISRFGDLIQPPHLLWSGEPRFCFPWITLEFLSTAFGENVIVPLGEINPINVKCPLVFKLCNYIAISLYS